MNKIVNSAFKIYGLVPIAIGSVFLGVESGLIYAVWTIYVVFVLYTIKKSIKIKTVDERSLSFIGSFLFEEK